jgi:hypothetical protein
MFLRWQSGKRRMPSFDGWGKYVRGGSNEDNSKQDVRWAAIVVESVRIAGKPTQRHIAYLGGITDSAIAIVHQRCWFWDEATQRLDRVGDRMSSQDRKRIEAAVAQKVPRPTKAQYERCRRERDELLGPPPR